MPRKPKTKPFLVLPLLESEVLERSSPNIFDMPMKNTGLQLFTKTWPPNKKTKDSDENKRPLTATLEKPTILDIRLIGKIDMSKIRKEFLNISNLCRIPLIIKKSKNSKMHRPLSLPPTNLEKKQKKISNDDLSVDDDESTRSVKVKGKRRVSKLEKIDGKLTVNVCDNNNNHSKNFRTPRKHPSALPIGTGEKTAVAVAIVPAPSDTKSSSSTKLPQPCNSCGRPDQPERLHSHPIVSTSKTESSARLEVKSSVQKPIAIKYKSKSKTKPEEKIPSPTRKNSLPAQNLVHSNPSSATMSKLDESRANYYKKKVSSSKGGRPTKITLTCYICGREYGTQSLPLHEPKCLEKWERENSLLPKHLQRKAPLKPSIDGNDKEEWNTKAWEAAQANLVPCPNCNRTFYPDRLEVHLRSCKPKYKDDSIEHLNLLNHSVRAVADIRANPILSPQPINNRLLPQNWQCYICKKKFSGNTIKEHEKRCLKQWKMENENQEFGASPPQKNIINKDSLSPKGNVHGRVVQSADNKEKAVRPVSSRKPPLFPCYLCGKLFSVNSIYIHEPQCLKKWQIENNKLPPSKRRPVPQKPDIKFTQEGKISYEEMQEDNWHSHLSQLVPCKHCKRTFNPDRVEVHEKSCKGP